LGGTGEHFVAWNFAADRLVPAGAAQGEAAFGPLFQKSVFSGRAHAPRTAARRFASFFDE
jgi:hypothetical protein